MESISQCIDNDGSESDATNLFQDCVSNDELSETSDSHEDFMLDESFLDENGREKNLNDVKKYPISNEDDESSETSSDASSESNGEDGKTSKTNNESLMSRFLKQCKKKRKKGGMFTKFQLIYL